MDMKKRLKRFFTWNCRHAGGFTLVELIVVIAILAILGGVAIPVYSGYITKANEAADVQLLAAVNTAFATACIQNGVDARNVPEQPVLTLTRERAVESVSIYNTEFLSYFAGNTDAKFKTDNAIVFDSVQGMFVLMLDGTTVTLKYGNGYITISSGDAKALANSTFNTEMGMEALLDKVNEVADFASALNNDTFNEIIGSEEFQRAFLENLGINTDEYQYDWELAAPFEAELAKMSNKILTEKGIDPATATEEQRRAADKEVKSNMAILYAAQSTQSMTDKQIEDLLNTDTPKQTILSGATNAAQLSQAAMYYGMYVAYAQNSGNADLIEDTENPFTLLTSLNAENTAGFKAYLKTDQGKADLDAYLASMNMIRDSATGNTDAVGNLMVNGFNDPELIKLLQQAVGN